MLGGQLFGPGGNTTPEIGSMGSQYGLLQRRQSGKGCAVPVRCPSIPAISSLCAPSAGREESTQRSALANRSMSDDDHNLDDLKDRLYRSFGVEVRPDLQVRAEIIIQPEEGRWVLLLTNSGIWRTALSPYCSIQARQQDGRSVSRSSNTSGCSGP